MEKEALKLARQLLWRYRHEIHIGHQPYMICHQADEAFERIDEALEHPEIDWEGVARIKEAMLKVAFEENQLLKKALAQPEKKVTGTEKLVCQDIEARQQLGLKKYGTSVQDNPLPLKEWLEHAYQEALDLSIYLKRAMQELEEK